MQVKVTIEFTVDVEPLEELEDGDELDEGFARGAADMAVHEAIAFVEGNVGYNLDVAKHTDVHADGFGECRVHWPEGELIDGETMTLTTAVE